MEGFERDELKQMARDMFMTSFEVMNEQQALADIVRPKPTVFMRLQRLCFMVGPLFTLAESCALIAIAIRLWLR